LDAQLNQLKEKTVAEKQISSSSDIEVIHIQPPVPNANFGAAHQEDGIGKPIPIELASSDDAAALYHAASPISSPQETKLESLQQTSKEHQASKDADIANSESLSNGTTIDASKQDSSESKSSTSQNDGTTAHLQQAEAAADSITKSNEANAIASKQSSSLFQAEDLEMIISDAYADGSSSSEAGISDDVSQLTGARDQVASTAHDAASTTDDETDDGGEILASPEEEALDPDTESPSSFKNPWNEDTEREEVNGMLIFINATT
jgi:hypothetical protein